MPRSSRVDARTKTMSATALTCRTLSHAMTPIPVPAARRLELRQLGQYEIRMVCMRMCTRWRRDVFDADTNVLVSSKGGYGTPDTYLVQAHGTGRLPRTAARAAFRAVVGEPKSAVIDDPGDWSTPAPAKKSAPAAKQAPAKQAPAKKAATMPSPARKAAPVKAAKQVEPDRKKPPVKGAAPRARRASPAISFSSPAP